MGGLRGFRSAPTVQFCEIRAGTPKPGQHLLQGGYLLIGERLGELLVPGIELMWVTAGVDELDPDGALVMAADVVGGPVQRNETDARGCAPER